MTPLPPFTAFHSIVDTTVSGKDLVRVLAGTPAGGGELVVFDINRRPRMEPFFKVDVDAAARMLAWPDPLPFDVTLVTNRDKNTREIEGRHRATGSSEVLSEPLGVEWPAEVLCLSHSAIPFSPDDPLYGDGSATGGRGGPTIGSLAIRGERGALALSDETLMRMRYNPFFGYVERRIVESLPRWVADEDVLPETGGAAEPN